MCFLLQCVRCNAEILEPQCLSSYDFLHKLMYKVIKVEEDVKNFKLFTDKLREDRLAEEKENRKLLQEAIEAFTKTSQEQLKQDRVAEEELRNQLSVAIEAFTNKSQEQLQRHVETSKALLSKTEDSANALATKVAGLVKCKYDETYNAETICFHYPNGLGPRVHKETENEDQGQDRIDKLPLLAQKLLKFVEI